MRIIRGKFGGRRLTAPSSLPVRPTTDMARESLFNIIENHFDIEGLEILDLYAGTGSISFEFISRDCEKVTAVDINHRCLAHLSKIKREWDIHNMELMKRDVLRFLKKTEGKWDIIFADPPYDSKDIKNLPGLVLESNLLNPGGWFILEHGQANDFTSHPGLHDSRKYSQVHFSIFKDKE